MLNLDNYSYRTNNSFLDYEFKSIGPKGIIKKIARFKKIHINIYTFGFGDLNEQTGEISDTIVSNNNDGDMVLAIVADIIYYFTNKHNDAIIIIEGSTAGRIRRYQMGINKYWDQINAAFEVFGLKNDKWIPFKKDENYTVFLGKRRNLPSFNN